MSLPLGGYYRPGRCIPVAIESAARTLRIGADGAVPTDVQPFEHGRIVPFLILSASVQSMKVGDRDIPIRALGPNEKLVAASSTIDASEAPQLFPGQTVIPVRLDSLPQPSRAWEALDAIILARPMPSELLAEVLANGTTVAVRSDRAPDETWPWKQSGDYWVLKAEIAGPIGAIGGEAAYLPLQSWQIEQPAFLRYQIVVVGELVSLLVLATLLIRNRNRSIIAMFVVVLLCGGSIAAWRSAQLHVQVQSGAVEIIHNGFRQFDRWWYVAAAPSGADRAELIGNSPMLLNLDQGSFLQLKLDCLSDGSMQWRYNLPTNARLALLNRSVLEPSENVQISAAQPSPLSPVVKEIYLSPGTRVLGQYPSFDKTIIDPWPTVVVGPD